MGAEQRLEDHAQQRYARGRELAGLLLGCAGGDLGPAGEHLELGGRDAGAGGAGGGGWRLVDVPGCDQAPKLDPAGQPRERVVVGDLRASSAALA